MGKEKSVSGDCFLCDCLSSTEEYSVHYLDVYNQFHSETCQAGGMFLVLQSLAYSGLTYNWYFCNGNNQQNRISF